MDITTLCYIEKGEKYLMLHRVSKKNDINRDKWIGIGGHFENAESPDECLIREVREETGLTLTKFRPRGIVTFIDDSYLEYMFLYTADCFTGEITKCSEGTLEWVNKKDVFSLNIWEGDKVFLKLLEENSPFFSLKLIYSAGILTEIVLNGNTVCQ